MVEVLYANDSPMECMIAEVNLRRAFGSFIRLTLRHTSEDALSALASSSYDLLIVDSMMPKFGGAWVVQHLRTGFNEVGSQLATRRGIPVIVHSAADFERTKEVGFDYEAMQPLAHVQRLDMNGLVEQMAHFTGLASS